MTVGYEGNGGEKKISNIVWRNKMFYWQDLDELVSKILKVSDEDDMMNI
jgi:hypothetical protein